MQELLNRVQRHNLFAMYDHDSYCKVEDHELVALKKKNLPNLVKQAKLHDACVQSHDPLGSVHFDDHFALLQVLVQFFILIGEQQVDQVQAAFQVGQDLGATVELGVQVVRNVLSNKSLEESVHARKIEAVLAAGK